MTLKAENSNNYTPFYPTFTKDEELSIPEIREGFNTWSASQAGIIRRKLRYERQTRDLTPAGLQHQKLLADLMRRNQWREKEKIDFAKLDDRLILINGHHSLGAQAISGLQMEWLVVIHECSSPAQIAELYYTFDTNVRIRSSHTILSVVDLASSLGIGKNTASWLWSAAPLLNSNFDFTIFARTGVMDKAIDRRLEIAKSYKREIKMFEKATGSASKTIRRKTGSAGALAVALTTLRYQPGYAEPFWSGVALNDGLRKGDPRHTYNRYLNGELAQKNVLGYTAWCAAIAWNAWYNDRQLSFIKIGSTFRIDGTPIEHRKAVGTSEEDGP